MSPDPADEPDVTLSATFRVSDGPTVSIRNMFFGTTPAIYIEPEAGAAENEVVLKLDVIDFEPDELVDILDLIRDGIQRGIDNGDLKVEP